MPIHESEAKPLILLFLDSRFGLAARAPQFNYYYYYYYYYYYCYYSS